MTKFEKKPAIKSTINTDERKNPYSSDCVTPISREKRFSSNSIIQENQETEDRSD
jgi:hypothetical protein